MKKFEFGKNKRNINNANKLEKSKSKKKISKDLKEKFSNLEIKPQFLIIGFIAIIMVISLIYFIFLKYSPIMNFKYEGYAIKGKEITENLLGASKNSDSSDNTEKNIDLAKIEEQGTIFKKLGTYFIGNKEKTEIDLNYPIYINDKNTIYNLSQDIMLISKDFEKVSGYPNISITDGKVYNGNSLERADSKEYIFAKTEEGIYINLKEIKINTTANEYVIPANSLIVFEENEIKYYSLADNILLFNKINDVDYNSKVIIKNINNAEQNIQNATNNLSIQKVDNQYNYEELLTRLGIIGNAKNDVENSKEEITKEDTTENQKEESDEEENKQEDETTPSEDKQEGQLPENDEEGGQANKYIKPEVTVDNFTAEVYTAKSILHIKDPVGRIIEAPTFEIYKDGKIYLRRTYTQAGEIIVTGLDADTEYEIIGKYIYKNEEDKKIENTFFSGTVKTKGYEALGIIELAKEEGEIYNNKIQIKNVKITSDLHNEVIKGIDTVELKTGSIKTVLKNKELNDLIQGKEITIESSEGLKSNEKIEYELKFYDKKGKELKVENNKGKTRTSKQEPKVTIKIKEQDIVSVTLGLKLANKDNVNLESYKYVVRKPNGEIEKEERLSQDQKEIKLDDLDSNQYYSLKIYADYDLNNNKGMQKQVEIGDLVFATQPLSTLGSVELKVEGKDITTDKATLSYEIDEERTDKRLIQILNSIKVELINKNTGKVVKTTEIQDEELQTLKSGQKLEKTYEDLVSNTTYEIRITSKVKPGTKEESAPVTYNYQSFTTVKAPAKVEIQNKFVTKDLIDLDVRIEDKDNAILNNKVRMELRDEKNTLVETSEVKTNKDWLRKTYNKLEENKTYTLKFFADEYNEGHTDATYKRNYLLKEIDILTEEGITGKIDLKSMLKKTTGKNLIDPSSKIKWYTQFIGYSEYYNKTYEEETNTLKIGPGKKGYSKKYVYDLREYIGEEITISFKIKADEGIKVHIQNSKKNYQKLTQIKDIDKDNFKEYKQTLVVDDTGYVGFYIENSSKDDNAKAYIKDLQIELGNTKTSYEKYKYNMESKIQINLEDKRDEIITNDYYIKIYEDGKLIDTKKYEDFPENNKIENAEKELNIKEDHNYKLELAVKIRLRDYVISTFEFNTKNGEILGIGTVEEYKEIQPEGNYIVLNDLDFRKETDNYKIKFSENIKFQGNINFNGKTIYKKYFDGGNNAVLFSQIGEKGKIENLVLKVYISSELPSSGYNLFTYNYGTISNLIVSLEESKEKNNTNIGLLGYYNYGTIENFIINYKEPLYAQTIYCLQGNSGVVQNGYIYGKDIKINQNDDVNSILISQNNGTIKQLYVLANAYVDVENTKANYSKIVRDNRKIVENVYSVGIGNIYYLDAGPNIVIDSLNKVNNSYYIGDIAFKGKRDKKITNKALWDKSFQNNILNSTNMWEVDELVSLGYYPWLKLDDCMPRQEYIALPEMTDKDLPEILFAETLEKTNKTAKVKISVYNPSGEEITDIKVKNLDCTIESQEYANGRSEVIVNLSNPIQCVSSYSILSFTTKGAFNLEYTKEYNEGEILINVDLYNEIYTIEDWYEMQKKNSQNYKIMANLDFKNADPKKYANINLYGILDGMGHSIQNMYLPKTLNKALFENIGSKTVIKNLNIKNYNLESMTIGNVGIIGYGNGLTLENVNIDTVNIISSGVNIGGIIGTSNSYEFKDITLNNINILVKDAISPIVGGLVGNGVGNITNVYANNINIKVENISESAKVGGIIGNGYDLEKRISNVIINGNIEADSGKVGGIIGSGATKTNNNIVKVNIVANGNFVGGLEGEKGSTTVEVKNNLYIGNIVNKKETEYTGALFGRYSTPGINYIYNKNKINGLNIESEYKLGLEELSKEKTYTDILNFDNSYIYDDLNNKLPLLKNSDKTNLLPNQKQIYIEEQNIDIHNVSTLKEDGNRLKVRIEIANPNNLEISEVVIENMDIQIIDKRTINGITYVELIANPTKYYDNYQIKEIKYIKDGKENSKHTYYLIEEAFYKEITKFEDWQNIDKESYENYRLLTDLDFTGKQNINYNLKIGRLITEGNTHSIKNITLNVGNSKNFGLISILKNGIENIKFENINIICSETAPRISSVGIIGRCEGNIHNIDFSKINIDIKKSISNIGCIGIYEGLSIDTIKADNVYINGKAENYIGGIFGKLNYMELQNIEANNINIDIDASLVGGIIGHMNPLMNTTISRNIKITNSNIKGNKDVGGLGGYGGFQDNAVIDNCTVEGNELVGGIVGDMNYGCGQLKNITVLESHIKGKAKIGGISGGGGNMRYCKVINSTVEGMENNSTSVGGILGQQYWPIYYTQIKDSKVISKGIKVGGIVGTNYGPQYGSGVERSFAENVSVEGYANVGGIAGYMSKGNISNSYTNANVVATEHSAGGIVGTLNNTGMDNLNNVSQIYNNYYARGTVQSKENVGGIIGEMLEKLFMPEKYYTRNYIEANVLSTNNTVSLGIGNMPRENQRFVSNYYYKYSTINGKYPNKENEVYIADESYLVENDLKQADTYKNVNKLNWGNNYDYEILNENKYPIIRNGTVPLEGQAGISIPSDPKTEEIENTNTDNKEMGKVSLKEENNKAEISEEYDREELQYTFKYNGKIIKTYETYSEILADDGSKVIREDVRLYVKDGKLYALPVSLKFGGNALKIVANNFVINSYNGKEYETVLGSDGKLYDLKETLNYPENFVNSNIERIGNNLDLEDFAESLSGNDKNEISIGKFSQKESKNEHEVEVVYKSGDKLKFNYQTGEIVSFSKSKEQKESTADSKFEASKDLLEYVKEQFSKIGNYTNTDKINIEMQNKYEETIKLENKLEEISVEEAIKKYKVKNSGESDFDEEKSKNEDNNINANIGEAEKTEDNNETNNSLKEKKYISIYNAEKDDYQIYQEEELLDTSKQEVISENEKIEANNLNEYYASDGKATNMNMGIVWIALSIIGVIIILFVIKKRD